LYGVHVDDHAVDTGSVVVVDLGVVVVVSNENVVVVVVPWDSLLVVDDQFEDVAYVLVESRVAPIPVVHHRGYSVGIRTVGAGVLPILADRDVGVACGGCNLCRFPGADQ